MECMYCQETAKTKDLLIKIGELDYSVLYLLKDQKQRGRCVLALKNHREELFQLTEEEMVGFYKDASRVAKALYELFHPGKINYGIFGDKVPHFHMHIVPKYEGGVQWGGFFNDADESLKVFLSDSEYQHIVNLIKEKVGC